MEAEYHWKHYAVSIWIECTLPLSPSLPEHFNHPVVFRAVWLSLRGRDCKRCHIHSGVSLSP